MEQQATQESMRQLFKDARIRREYWSVVFEDVVFDDDSVKEDIRAFLGNLLNAKKYGLGMFFTGDYGQGKTMIASIILKRALKEGHSAYFVSAFEFLNYYSGFGFEERKFRAFVKKVGFLCIDDLASESIKARDYSFSLIDNLLAERQNATILTSNRDSTELARIYGDHLLEFLNTGKVREVFVDSGKKLRNTFNWNEVLVEGMEEVLKW